MHKASEAVLELKPVTFNYKKELDPDGATQFGLIGEQVEKIDPNLIVRDEDGKVSTVRYEAVNAMLLNEFLKEDHKVESLQATLAQQQKEFKEKLWQQRSVASQQQKQIEALTATVQKVNDRIELNATPATLAANSQ
jgi:predicted RNase H-like nuclease (RuvC/YqgF family)